MSAIYYIRRDIHKKTIAYCIKKNGSTVEANEPRLPNAQCIRWMTELPDRWFGAMENTIFTCWVYNFLRPHDVKLKVGHSAMLRSITAAKKKNERADAKKIADLLRETCSFCWCCF